MNNLTINKAHVNEVVPLWEFEDKGGPYRFKKLCVVTKVKAIPALGIKRRIIVTEEVESTAILDDLLGKL